MITYRIIKFIPKDVKEPPFYVAAEVELNVLDEKTGEAEIVEWREALISGDSVSAIFEEMKKIQFALAQPPLIFDEAKNNFIGEEDIQEYTSALKKLSKEVESTEKKVTFGHH